MKQHTSVLKVQMEACGVLLMISTKSVQHVRSSNVIECITSAMRCHEQAANWQLSACDALQLLIPYLDCREFIVAATSCIVLGLRQRRAVDRLQQCGCELLAQLLIDGNSRTELDSSGATELVKERLQQNGFLLGMMMSWCEREGKQWAELGL